MNFRNTALLVGLFGLNACLGQVSDLELEAERVTESAADAGTDAGLPVAIDAGLSVADAGHDAGAFVDAGAGVVDAGTTAVIDAGTTAVVDAGVEEVDAGTSGPGCTLPSMPNCSGSCCSHGGNNPFAGEISAAQDLLRADHPEWFDAMGFITISDLDYTTALAARLQPMFAGCVVGGEVGGVSRDEIGLKTSNGQSIHVDVVISTGAPWVGVVYSCFPADF